MVTIHTSTYVTAEIQTADMRNVIMNHFFQNLLRQSGMVRNSRRMIGRDRTQMIRFRSFSGMANTLFVTGENKDRQDRSQCQASLKGQRIQDDIIPSVFVRHVFFRKLPSGISLSPCRLRERFEYPESSWKIPLSVLERLWTLRLVSSLQPISGWISLRSPCPLPRQVQQGLNFLRTYSLMRRSKHSTTMYTP